MAKAIRPNYIYLGGKIKKCYLSYAYCSCGKYLLPKKYVCPQCKENVDWTDVVENLHSINEH